MLSKSYKNIDFLHVAGHSGGTAAALVWAKIRKIPVLMELVTEYARHQQKYLFIFKVSAPKNSMVVALTEKSKIECMQIGLSEKNLWWRPNPINEKKFFPDFSQKYSLRNSLTPFNENKVVISNVAKIMPQKNQLLILDILPFLPENYVAVIAGPLIKEGPLYERDKAYIERIYQLTETNKLQNRVHLVPSFVEAEHYMKLADIYVMPAWNEGFGTPMMEAMACGLPVVANSKEIAFQEWIIPDKNGYLCDIDDPESWAKAIEKASIFSKKQCLEISANIHKKAGQEAIYNHYEDIIKTLLADH